MKLYLGDPFQEGSYSWLIFMYNFQDYTWFKGYALENHVVIDLVFDEYMRQAL